MIITLKEEADFKLPAKNVKYFRLDMKNEMIKISLNGENYW